MQKPMNDSNLYKVCLKLLWDGLYAAYNFNPKYEIYLKKNLHILDYSQISITVDIMNSFRENHPRNIYFIK